MVLGHMGTWALGHSRHSGTDALGHSRHVIFGQPVFTCYFKLNSAFLLFRDQTYSRNSVRCLYVFARNDNVWLLNLILKSTSAEQKKVFVWFFVDAVASQAITKHLQLQSFLFMFVPLFIVLLLCCFIWGYMSNLI